MSLHLWRNTWSRGCTTVQCWPFVVQCCTFIDQENQIFLQSTFPSYDYIIWHIIKLCQQKYWLLRRTYHQDRKNMFCLCQGVDWLIFYSYVSLRLFVLNSWFCSPSLFTSCCCTKKPFWQSDLLLNKLASSVDAIAISKIWKHYSLTHPIRGVGARRCYRI